jgi:hypothetical protein
MTQDGGRGAGTVRYGCHGCLGTLEAGHVRAGGAGSRAPSAG